MLLTDQRPFSGEADQILLDVQQGRFSPPSAVKPAVPRALEAICLRAMALDPCKRYDTALQLAEDIERWLADEPVTAWNDPWLDRCESLGSPAPTVRGRQRRRRGVALLALGLAVPVLSLAWGNESAARRNEQKLRILAMQKAEEAQELQKRGRAGTRRPLAASEPPRSRSETKANEEKDRAEKALEFLVAAFRKPDPAFDGRSLKVVDLLDRSCARDQPIISRSTSDGSDALECDRPDLRRAGDAGEVVSGLSSGPSPFAARALGEDHPETVRALHNLAMAFQDAGRLDQAISLLERTLARRKAVDDGDPSELIESLNDLAVAYWESGQPARADPALRSRAREGARPVGRRSRRHALDHRQSGRGLCGGGEAGRAISLHEAVLQRLRAKLGEEHLTTLVTMNNLARAYEAGLRHDESIELYEKTVPKLRAKLSDDHPTVLTAMCGMARAYQSVGRRSQAIGLFEDALAKRRVKLGDVHPETLMTLFELASAYSAAEQPEKGLTLAREFLDRTRQAGDSLPLKVRETIPRATKLWESLAERVKFVSP